MPWGKSDDVKRPRLEKSLCSWYCPSFVSSLVNRAIWHWKYFLQKRRGILCGKPASIAVVLPRHLSGVFLKPLRAWDYPNNLPFVPKRWCWVVYNYTFHRSNLCGKINPLRYRGYVYDTETELYYLRSRYYDPTIGRFMNSARNSVNVGEEYERHDHLSPV